MKCYSSKNLFLILSFISLLISSTVYSSGYFQLHNLMSAAQKNEPNNNIFNDAKYNLENIEKGTGNVVNTQFANDGGMAGCGITSSLMQYMYQKAGSNVDLSKNYIALNVYSQIMGFDPNAPFWGDPEGSVKGYLTQNGATNVAYPYTPYHRVIPSIYPAYLGLFNNGLNCGRWIEANFDTQNCLDRTTTTGISKYCPNASSLTFAGQKIQGYVFDSCEDNNGWCRDDEPHIDVNVSAFTTPNNYYLQWKFISNPYYSNVNSPSWLKDIWLAWFGQASKYWSYVAILNAENGLSIVQYNVGGLNNPTWVNSHVLAGDNNITWSSSSNNGGLWQMEPVNSLTDSAPSDNPIYEMRSFDYLGYPNNHGAVYQFSLLFQDGTMGQSVNGFSFFYQGGSPVKSGTQTQNMLIHTAPTGNGTVTISFNQLLPSDVSLQSTQPNYIRPVLISSDGYSYDASQCNSSNQCTFSGLPTSTTFNVFAHSILDVSNDLTLRKVNDVLVNSANINFTSGSTSTSYSLQNSDINLSTLYSARVTIPLKFSTTSTTSINGNLQALFVPDATKNAANNISAQTQGCFLNNYVNSMTGYLGNNSTCTIYYTVNHESNFASTTPVAYFTVKLPTKVGFNPVNYALSTSASTAIQVTGYNPPATPSSTTIPLVSYTTSTSATRSFYLILDPQSDATCLKNLSNVPVTVGSTSVTLTSADQPVEIQISQSISTITAQVNLVSGSTISCQAIPSLPASSLNPGIDVVEVIKLFATPKAEAPKPINQGIAATATGDNACLNAIDTLIFSSNGTVAINTNYTTNTTSTNVDVNVTPGTYTISDTPFNVAGGSCQLSNSPSISIQNNIYTPVSLSYKFTQAAGSSCTAIAKVTGSWPNGCTVQFSLSSALPLSNVTLSWANGSWNWNNALPWGGEGSLNIPSVSTGTVTWLFPSWVNGQGSSVGMNVNGDGTPSICAALSAQSIKIGCTGIATK